MAFGGVRHGVSARQYIYPQKKNQADDSPERGVEGGMWDERPRGVRWLCLNAVCMWVRTKSPSATATPLRRQRRAAGGGGTIPPIFVPCAFISERREVREGGSARNRLLKKR